MKKVFVASLCYMGAQGGGILLSDDSMIFKTQKLTLAEDYKKIQIDYRDIRQIRKDRSLFVFPAVVITKKNGMIYKFIIFNRKRFLQMLRSRL